MFRNFLLTAWRSLLRQRITMIINVLGLTLGITACLIIFLLLRFELGYDQFHPDKDRIFRFVADQKGPNGESSFGFVTTSLPDAARAEIGGLEAVAGFDNLYTTVKAGNVIFDAAKNGEEASPIILAQPQYFSIFQYHWLAGNAASALNEPFRVVLTAKEATKYFGPRQNPEDWMGRHLIYSDSLDVTVSGIVADWEEKSDYAFRDFISFETIRASFLRNRFQDSWGMWDYMVQVVVKLAPGASPARVRRQLGPFMARHHQGPKEFYTDLVLQPLNDIHFNGKYPDAFSRKVSLPALYGLGAIAVFILLIAAINFINLATAQSVRRSKEIGVRKVLGGRRGAIVWQFLCETLILVLAAAMLALLIANPLVSAFGSLLPTGIELQVFGWPTLWFMVVIVIVTCLLAGLYPARVLSAFKPAQSLKGQGIRPLNNKSYLRKALIVFQFTVSLIFIIATLVIERQVHYVLNTDLGFNHDAIVMIRTPPMDPRHQRAVLARKLRQIPEVQMVARHMEAPTAKGHPGTFIERVGADESQRVIASLDMVDTGYIPLFGMHLLAGRNLFASDTVREFIVNETCAKQLGYRRPKDALGQQVNMGWNGRGPIVGVIRDFHSASLHEPITPFFLTSNDWFEDDMSIKLATRGRTASDLTTALGKLATAWKEVYPEKKFDYSFFDETIARLYDKEQKMAEIMNIAMGIAIFIACLGLFGLATFVAEQRTKEIGIRKVLGATVANIVMMLSKDFLWLVGLAILIASPVAWYFMQKWLQDFAYRVPISWWIYVVAGGAAIGIALLTVSYQAIRAAIANPVDSLRAE